MKRKYDYENSIITLFGGKNKAPSLRVTLRRLVRAALIRDWEIDGAHQGAPSSAYMNRIVKELIP